MQLRKLVAALLLLAAAVTAQDDPLRTAIMSKTREQLEEICVKASIPWTPGGDMEELRGKVYEYAQREKPGEAKPWKAGAGGAAAAGASAASAEQKQSELMFNAMDVAPKDGKLSRAEMKAMLDKVNAAAMAAGEATVDPNDFFKAMDKNHDEFVDRSEASELGAYLAGLSKGGAAKGGGSKPKGGSKPAAAKAPKAPESSGDMAAMMFASLDADKDGKLSKAEMKALLEKTAEHNKAQGVEEDADFWDTLDADKSGFVDMKEANWFFAAMLDGMKDEL